MGDYIFGPPPPPPSKSSTQQPQQQQQHTSQHTYHPAQHNNRRYGHQRNAPYALYDRHDANQQRQEQRNPNRVRSSTTSGGYGGSNAVGSGYYRPPTRGSADAHGTMTQSYSGSYNGMMHTGPLVQPGPLVQQFSQSLESPAPDVQRPATRNNYNPSLISTSIGQPASSDMGYYYPQPPFAAAHKKSFNNNEAEEDEDVDDEAALGWHPAASGATATIPGTTISLQTEEDIAKWINERKKNWPTVKRIQEKEEELRRKQAEAEEARKAKGKFQEEKTNQESTMFAKGNICKFFAKTGRCNRGSKCPFSHERLANTGSALNTKKYKRYGRPQKMPLFKRLVQNDWDKENEKILDFVSYLVDIGVVSKSKAT
ncbi:nuclear fragile X mental retardation-interacting protein 1-domain-containing protein [Lipomyces kononenkoae]|uniref:Nuclear fragile X mental retardation-interacting protein 1-domain-containing protein n=1 Tax=Lipomyces kononenkoae TaxID=34357 RepID=A0ACC3T0A0_LIPKO